MKLTERVIAGLTVPEGRKDMLVFDDVVAGLGLRISARSKSFICQYTAMDGAKKRIPLGRWGALTLEQARVTARAILGQVAAGDDPAAKRKAAKKIAKVEAQAERLTLRALLDDWAALALAERRESYRKEAVRAVSFAFADFLDRRADTLTKAEAVRVLDGLAKAGKHAMAGRTMAYARACYGWAMKRDRVTNNPFQGLPIPAAVASRDRVLSDDETGAVYAAAGAMGYPFGPLIRMLLLTAQRREEVAALRWSEISDDMTIWTLPAGRAKNGREHVVHLSDEARAVLVECPRQAGTDLVFTTTGATPVSGFSKATERLTVLAERERIERAARAGKPPPRPMAEWRLHDFRRACVTWLAGAGFNPAVADKLLNHVAAGGLSDVARVYQRNAFLPERKVALEAWGKHVLACARGDAAAGNVVALNRKPA